jgi:hypothetical protein
MYGEILTPTPPDNFMGQDKADISVQQTLTQSP